MKSSRLDRSSSICSVRDCISSMVNTVACISSASLWVNAIVVCSTSTVCPMIWACLSVLAFCSRVKGSCWPLALPCMVNR
nr:hypothetical protein CPGR_05708 [Mycolicibacter nonchromogenicus]